MLSTPKFILGFVFKTLRYNFSRSLAVIFSFILVLSATVAMFGWLEASPKVAVERIFESRGFEIEVSELNYQNGSFDYLKDYLEIEPLVGSTSVIHRSLFLYNLEGRAPNFNIVEPPANESDFYISNNDMSNGVFFLPDNFLANIQTMLKFEEGSNVTFSANGDGTSGIIISRRLLNVIKETTNDSYEIGDKFNFAFARSALSSSFTNLSALQPKYNENFTINAVFDRIPYKSQYGLRFYHETLGDGIFVSHNILSPEDIYSLESEYLHLSRIFFVQINRNALIRSPTTQIVHEINNLATRIKLQGSFDVRTQTEELYRLLFYFDQSRVVLLLLLLPILILVEIFYLSSVPHLLRNRIDEFHYLRVRGTTDGRIFVILGIEFAFLATIGSILGIFGGVIFLDLLSSTTDFLGFNGFSLRSGLSLLTDAEIWIYGACGVVLLNSFYFLQKLGSIIRQLQQREGVVPSSRVFAGTSARKNTIKLLVSGLGVYLMFSLIGPVILSEFGSSGISSQLVPLISVFLIIIWVFTSFYVPQFCLQVIQSFFESMRILKHPRRKITLLNLFRQRAQYLSFLALLTLTISLLSFTLVYFETLNKNNQKNADYLTGGDLKVITNSINVENFTSLAESIDGIDLCVGLPYRDVHVEGYSIRLIGVNPEKYDIISRLYSLSIVEGPTASSTLNELKENWNSTLIMNDFLATVFQWEVGEEIGVKGIISDRTEYPCTISAIAKYAPGLGPLYTEGITRGYYTYGGIAFVHELFLASVGNDEANTFLVKLSKTENQDSVINQLREMSDVRMVYTSNSALQDRLNSLQFAGVQGILTIDFLGGILISLIGIAVFYQYLVTERITEFAIFQALGATKRNISVMVLFESLILILLGLTLGLITGNLFAIGFLIASRSVTVGPYNIFLLELAFSPILLMITLIIITTIIILATAIPLKKVSSLELTNILRGE
ncbi:MAG: FtsX-like permease family protein [Candidatus Hodarchaeota archaeon]